MMNISQDGHVQVYSANPVYGNSPYTVQAGGCGSTGELIHVTPEYLINLNGTSTNQFGPPGNLVLLLFYKRVKQD